MWERNIDINQLPCTHPNWEPNPQPQNVPLLGVMTFQITGQCSSQLSHSGQGLGPNIACARKYWSLLMSSAQPTSITRMWPLSGTSIFSFLLQFLSHMQNVKRAFHPWSYSLCSRRKQLSSCWCRLSTYYVSGPISPATCENHCEVDRASN